MYDGKQVISAVLLWDDRDCGGERIEIVDESVDFCSLVRQRQYCTFYFFEFHGLTVPLMQRFLTGEEVNNRVKSVLVPAGLRVQFFQECGATDTVDGPDIDNRPSPQSRCDNLPLKLSHIKLIRS